MDFCAMCLLPDRPFLLRNSRSLSQSRHVLKSCFLSSRRSLQGACLSSPVAAGAATLAVVTASTSQQITQMAPGQVISVLRNIFHISKLERWLRRCHWRELLRVGLKSLCNPETGITRIRITRSIGPQRLLPPFKANTLNGQVGPPLWKYFSLARYHKW